MKNDIEKFKISVAYYISLFLLGVLIANGWFRAMYYDCWSGTTGVVCKNTNRNYVLIEKEPEYIDIINKRLNND